MESILVKRLRTKSIFKLIFIGLSLSVIPLSVLIGVLGYFDLATVTWNNEPVTGAKTLVVGPMIGLLFVTMFGLFTTLFTSLGLFFYAKKSNLKLEFYAVDDSHS